jgi:hypothetical protein
MLDWTLHRTRFSFTTVSGLGVHQRVRSFPKFLFEISNWTLHRTRLCRPPRPVPVTTTASGHPFQAVADAAEAAERGGRSSGIRIGESRFHLEGRQLGTEATEETSDAPAEQPTEDLEETEEQTV